MRKSFLRPSAGQCHWFSCKTNYLLHPEQAIRRLTAQTWLLAMVLYKVTSVLWHEIGNQRFKYIHNKIHWQDNFVAYALPNWLQDRNDVVKLSRSGYQTSGGILNGLETPGLLVSNSKQQLVTVVKCTGNECVYQAFWLYPVLATVLHQAVDTADNSQTVIFQ